MKKLKERWQIKSNLQLAIIFVVFAINGSLSAKIGFFIMELISVNKATFNVVVYYLIATITITLIYPFLLIGISFIFGQFDFFFKFSKKMLKTIGLGFIFKEKKTYD